MLAIPTADQGDGENDSGTEPQPLIPAPVVHYTFDARVLPLEHWAIDEASIMRYRDGHPINLDVQELVLELQDGLGLPEDLVSTYLEELASTLAGGAFKLTEARQGTRPDVEGLLDADFQTVEAAMTEGHPGFLANNGRIGFALSDYRRWAPETGRLNRLEWVAVNREHAHLSVGAGLNEVSHLEWALSDDERTLFADRSARPGAVSTTSTSCRSTRGRPTTGWRSPSPPTSPGAISPRSGPGSMSIRRSSRCGRLQPLACRCPVCEGRARGAEHGLPPRALADVHA